MYVIIIKCNLFEGSLKIQLHVHSLISDYFNFILTNAVLAFLHVAVRLFPFWSSLLLSLFPSSLFLLSSSLCCAPDFIVTVVVPVLHVFHYFVLSQCA